ncbi:MAG: hypothetical protein AAB740_05610 [Patescibacteria group bacterium]
MVSDNNEKNVLSDEDVRKLVMARLSVLSSDTIFSLGSEGSFTRDELVKSVERGDSVGEKLAEIQMEASNQVMISLLKGNSAKDASERSKNKFKDNLFRLMSSNADPDSLQAAQLLFWNMRRQVCLGDIDAKL